MTELTKYMKYIASLRYKIDYLYAGAFVSVLINVNAGPHLHA